MTSKHSNKLARIIKLNLEDAGNVEAQRKAVIFIGFDIADFCAEQNEKFDYARFCLAAGLPEEK